MNTTADNTVSFDEFNAALNDYRKEMISEFHTGKCLVIGVDNEMLRDSLSETLGKCGEMINFYPINDNETLIVTTYPDERIFRSQEATKECRGLVDLGVQVVNYKTRQTGLTVTNSLALMIMSIYNCKRSEKIASN